MLKNPDTPVPSWPVWIGSALGWWRRSTIGWCFLVLPWCGSSRMHFWPVQTSPQSGSSLRALRGMPLPLRMDGLRVWPPTEYFCPSAISCFLWCRRFGLPVLLQDKSRSAFCNFPPSLSDGCPRWTHPKRWYPKKKIRPPDSDGSWLQTRSWLWLFLGLWDVHGADRYWLSCAPPDGFLLQTSPVAAHTASEWSSTSAAFGGWAEKRQRCPAVFQSSWSSFLDTEVGIWYLFEWLFERGFCFGQPWDSAFWPLVDRFWASFPWVCRMEFINECFCDFSGFA